MASSSTLSKIFKKKFKSDTFENYKSFVPVEVQSLCYVGGNFKEIDFGMIIGKLKSISLLSVSMTLIILSENVCVQFLKRIR